MSKVARLRCPRRESTQRVNVDGSRSSSLKNNQEYADLCIIYGFLCITVFNSCGKGASFLNGFYRRAYMIPAQKCPKGDPFIEQSMPYIGQLLDTLI